MDRCRVGLIAGVGRVAADSRAGSHGCHLAHAGHLFLARRAATRAAAATVEGTLDLAEAGPKAPTAAAEQHPDHKHHHDVDPGGSRRLWVGELSRLGILPAEAVHVAAKSLADLGLVGLGRVDVAEQAVGQGRVLIYRRRVVRDVGGHIVRLDGLEGLVGGSQDSGRGLGVVGDLAAVNVQVELALQLGLVPLEVLTALALATGLHRLVGVADQVYVHGLAGAAVHAGLEGIEAGRTVRCRHSGAVALAVRIAEARRALAVAPLAARVNGTAAPAAVLQVVVVVVGVVVGARVAMHVRQIFVLLIPMIDGRSGNAGGRTNSRSAQKPGTDT